MLRSSASCLLRLLSSNPARSLHHSRSVSESVSVTFIDKEGKDHTVQASMGKNFLEVAHENEIDLEGELDPWYICNHHLVTLELTDGRGLRGIPSLQHLSPDSGKRGLLQANPRGVRGRTGHARPGIWPDRHLQAWVPNHRKQGPRRHSSTNPIRVQKLLRRWAQTQAALISSSSRI